MCEPVNDIVCTLLQSPIPRCVFGWNDDHRMDVLTCERPTPFLDMTIRGKVDGTGRPYTFEVRTAWYDTNQWLCGSYYYKKLYCWPCLLLGNTRTKWNFEGYSGLVCMDGAFKRHANSTDHIQCVDELKRLRRSINLPSLSSPLTTATPPPPPSPSSSLPAPSFFLPRTSLPRSSLPTPSSFPPRSSSSSSSLPTTVSEPMNDIVCNLLEKPFVRWNDKDRADVLALERPTPFLDLKEEAMKMGGWNNIKFRSSWYKTHKWLCGSSYYKRLYCWPCLLLGKKGTKWNFEGFCGLVCMGGVFKRHASSKDHIECVEKLKRLRRSIHLGHSSSPPPPLITPPSPPPPSSSLPAPSSFPPRSSSTSSSLPTSLQRLYRLNKTTAISEPVNDIVYNILVKPFIEWRNKDRADVLAHGRPTPFPDITEKKKKVTKLQKLDYVKLRTAWYKDHDWLCGSFYSKRLYCWPCLLLGNKISVWNYIGIQDSKNLIQNAKPHLKSVDHIESVEKLKKLHKMLKREIKDCIKQQGLVKSLKYKEVGGSSSEVAEQPTLWESDKNNNSFEMDHAADSAYQCGEPEGFTTKIEIVKNEITDIEDEELSVPNSHFVGGENADEEGRQMLNDEPRRPFLPVEVKLEPADIVQDEFETADELSLPIMRPELSNLEDKPYELPSLKCEENEEFLQRPEFVPVEEDDYLEYEVNDLEVSSEASFSGEDDSYNSSSWGEDMFVSWNSADDGVEGSEVLSENKLLRVLQKRRRGREGMRRCREKQSPESKRRYLHRNQENINIRESLSPEGKGRN